MASRKVTPIMSRSAQRKAKKQALQKQAEEKAQIEAAQVEHARRQQIAGLLELHEDFRNAIALFQMQSWQGSVVPVVNKCVNRFIGTLAAIEAQLPPDELTALKTKLAETAAKAAA